MGSDGEEQRVEAEPRAETSKNPRRRILPFAVLVAGALAAAYIGSKAPRDQHVRLVLGPASERVRGLEIQYVAADGDVARDARMSFEAEGAPRIVSHEPQLVSGDYRVRIDLETREGRRSVERRVTLGGGTTQIDVAALVDSKPAASTSSAPEPRNAP